MIYAGFGSILVPENNGENSKEPYTKNIKNLLLPVMVVN